MTSRTPSIHLPTSAASPDRGEAPLCLFSGLTLIFGAVSRVTGGAAGAEARAPAQALGQDVGSLKIY